MQNGIIKTPYFRFTEPTAVIFHEAGRNSHSIASIFAEEVGSFSKLKIIGIDQSFLKYAKDKTKNRNLGE